MVVLVKLTADLATATARSRDALADIDLTAHPAHQAAERADACRSVVHNVKIPEAVCARIASRYLRSSEAVALGRTCRDWHLVISSPHAWQEACFRHILTAERFLAALQQPKFKELRCLDMPSDKAEFGQSFYSDINSCCPSLQYIGLDVSRVGVDGAFELLDSVPSPLAVRGLRCRCCSWVRGATVTRMLLAGFQNLRQLFLHSHSGSFGACVPHIGELAQLEQLSISVTTDQLCYWGGLSPEQSFEIGDASFAPIAEKCTKLRTLALDGMFGIGGKTWQNFARHNTALTHIRISWEVWSSVQQLRKTCCPIDFTVHPVFPHLIDFAGFAETLATIPSLEVFEYCPGTAIDRQIMMRGACKQAFCQSLIDMLHWANDRPGERVWRVDDWPSIAQQNLPLYSGSHYHGLCLADRYQQELRDTESGGVSKSVFFPTFRMLSCVSHDTDE